jgi:hypothetical protein
MRTLSIRSIAIVAITGFVTCSALAKDAVIDKRPRILIPLQRQGGTYTAPVLVNGAIILDFILDSGAADVSMPADVVMTLVRTGTLQANDFTGTQTYKLADGSIIPSATFRIRSLIVGNRVVEDVTGGVAPVEGSLLLGQSFLSRFKSWSIDNSRRTLVLEPEDGAMQARPAAPNAGTFYRARYLLAGFLLRAAVVCEGDGKRTVNAAFSLTIRAISNAYPDTIRQWMEEGSANFNTGVMADGIARECAYAMMVRRRAEQMQNQIE